MPGRRVFATKVYLGLAAICRNFDEMLILSQAIYWKDRAYYVPKDREGEPIEGMKSGWLIDRSKPDATLVLLRLAS